MAKLHGFKKNLNPECVAMAKLVAERTKERGVERFLGRRSQRKTATQVEEKNV